MSAALALIQAALSLLSTFAQSRVGNIVIAFVVAWLWSGGRHDATCRASIEAREQQLRDAHTQELAREAEAATRIAGDATARAGEDATVSRALEAKIEDLKTELAHERHDNASIPAITLRGPCAIDDAYARRVRSLDAGDRAPAPARRAH